MNNIDRFVDATNEMLSEEQRKYEEATNEKALYSELKEEAIKKERKARATMKELELAKLHAEKAKGIHVTSENTKTDHPVETTVVYTEEETHTAKKSGNGIRGFVIGAAAVLLLAGGYKLIKESKTGNIRLTSSSMTNASDSIKNNPETVNAENNDVAYNYENNEVIIIGTASTEEETQVVDSTITYEELTTDNFENLVADYANKYSNEYSAVSTEDITKFAVVANIDLLAEENPELIAEIAGDKTREEFLNDGAKLIGATVMNNFNVWNATNSTENFIRVSDIVYGEQKELMLKIEEYVDRIAEAANQGDADLVNEIVSEFLTDMNSGELSKLDDGVGFAAQVYIALISDGIARNYLNQENFDMLQVLKTSEKYVSNIFTVYERCMGDAKTYTR